MVSSAVVVEGSVVDVVMGVVVVVRVISLVVVVGGSVGAVVIWRVVSPVVVVGSSVEVVATIVVVVGSYGGWSLWQSNELAASEIAFCSECIVACS